MASSPPTSTGPPNNPLRVRSPTARSYNRPTSPLAQSTEHTPRPTCPSVATTTPPFGQIFKHPTVITRSRFPSCLFAARFNPFSTFPNPPDNFRWHFPQASTTPPSRPSRYSREKSFIPAKMHPL